MAVVRDAVFGAAASTGPSKAETVARLDALANIMDGALVIPGTRIQVGLDAIIGLMPVIGDVISAAISSYIVWEARRLGLPRWKIARMVGNIAFDTAIGAVPVVGDAMDVFFKSNRRNMKIVRDHLAKEDRRGTVDADYSVVRS